jgi:hypothetical protein
MNPFTQYAQAAGQILQTAPQTQADLAAVAEAAKYAKSREFGQQVSEAQTAAYAGGGLFLIMQVVQTAALVYIAYHFYKKANQGGGF